MREQETMNSYQNTRAATRWRRRNCGHRDYARSWAIAGAVLRTGNSVRPFARHRLLAGTQLRKAGPGRDHGEYGSGKPGTPPRQAGGAASRGASQAAAAQDGRICSQPAVTTARMRHANASAPNPSDLTFYQTVQQKDNAHPQLTPPEAAPPRASDRPPTRIPRSAPATWCRLRQCAIRTTPSC